MAGETQPPAAIRAGDSIAWSDPCCHDAYPPPDWSLTWTLRRDTGGTALVVAAMWIDTGYRFSVGASLTATLPAGTHEWVMIAASEGTDERVTVRSGTMLVHPDPTLADGDSRSVAVRTLAAIEATIEGRATKDADAYSIEGRSITRTPMADLLRLRSLYRREVAAERNPGGSQIQYRRIRM